MYNLGAVGFGHWFNRLYAGLRDSGEVRVAKVAGVSGVEGKIAKMREMGLQEKDYYRIEKNTPIPDSFYEGLDIVHISDPNEYHAEQTIQSLSHGKITITEKTWGTNREEFEKVAKFIEKNGLERKAYLHLHYLQKQLTKGLDGLLERYTAKYGKVKAVSESFFEVENEEDSRRSAWLFSGKNGGLFMDWIHTFEIVVNGAKADKADLADFELFMVNKKYDAEHPTGIAAYVGLSGKHFANGATCTMRMAKGTKKGIKAARFYFKSGAYLELEYLNSDEEFNSDKRGTWKLYNENRCVELGNAKGLNTSEVFVKDIIGMCHGKQAGLSVAEARILFEPQWEYQRRLQAKELNTSSADVDLFIRKGLSLEM
ncbi:MAG: hypothetical protein QXF01_00775 [Candidatus Micrarchaeaceae archaeon]